MVVFTFATIFFGLFLWTGELGVAVDQATKEPGAGSASGRGYLKRRRNDDQANKCSRMERKREKKKKYNFSSRAILRRLFSIFFKERSPLTTFLPLVVHPTMKKEGLFFLAQQSPSPSWFSSLSHFLYFFL